MKQGGDMSLQELVISRCDEVPFSTLDVFRPHRLSTPSRHLHIYWPKGSSRIFGAPFRGSDASRLTCYLRTSVLWFGLLGVKVVCQFGKFSLWENSFVFFTLPHPKQFYFLFPLIFHSKHIAFFRPFILKSFMWRKTIEFLVSFLFMIFYFMTSYQHEYSKKKKKCIIDLWRSSFSGWLKLYL